MCRVETVYQFVSCIDTSNGLQPELNKTNLTLHCGGGVRRRGEAGDQASEQDDGT
jgi:hypothetical protein